MTDKELIERAAKAAGLPECGWMADSFCYVKDNAFTFWSPLEDDGDIARLEATCGIDVEWHDKGVIASHDGGPIFRERFDRHGGDKNKARRYASTRAAAAMAGEKGLGCTS